MQLDSL